MTLTNLFAFALPSAFEPIRSLIGFLVVVCVFAIVIIACRWLLSVTGIAIPQPLLLILGIAVFLLFLLAFLNWSGLYQF
jgi:hypothetical protein